MSRMRGNLQVRFLGEEVVETTSLPDKASVEGYELVAGFLAAGFTVAGQGMELFGRNGHRAAFFCCSVPHRER